MTIRQLKLLEAMAKLNFSQTEAARRTGLTLDQVQWIKRRNNLRFRNVTEQRLHPAIAELRAYHWTPR